MRLPFHYQVCNDMIIEIDVGAVHEPPQQNRPHRTAPFKPPQHEPPLQRRTHAKQAIQYHHYR